MPTHARSRCLVFDSGIGGMGVVRVIRDLGAPGITPEITIDYLADTALFPYGEQPDGPLTERIVTLITAACAQLRPDAVVIACNTASTIALPALRARLDMPVVGCVPPIRWAGRVSQTRTIGLLSTAATARRAYVQALHREFAPDCRLIVHGARRLADLAERAFLEESVPEAQIAAELACLFKQEGGAAIDTIGLGCTHYTFLLPDLQRTASAGGKAIHWLDPAPAVAARAAEVLRGVPPSAAHAAPARLLLTAPPEDSDRFGAAAARLGFGAWEAFDAGLSAPGAP